jgi:hypothetical protein
VFKCTRFWKRERNHKKHKGHKEKETSLAVSFSFFYKAGRRPLPRERVAARSASPIGRSIKRRPVRAGSPKDLSARALTQRAFGTRPSPGGGRGLYSVATAPRAKLFVFVPFSYFWPTFSSTRCSICNSFFTSNTPETPCAAMYASVLSPSFATMPFNVT